jgi:nitrous oxide reductase accessory protein NosL
MKKTSLCLLVTLALALAGCSRGSHTARPTPAATIVTEGD